MNVRSWRARGGQEGWGGSGQGQMRYDVPGRRKSGCGDTDVVKRAVREQGSKNHLFQQVTLADYSSGNMGPQYSA